MEKLLHGFPRVFQSDRRALGEDVHPAVCVGIARLIVRGHRIEHTPRFLSGRSVIEVHERVSVDCSIENGELPTDGGEIDGHQYVSIPNFLKFRRNKWQRKPSNIQRSNV